MFSRGFHFIIIIFSDLVGDLKISAKLESRGRKADHDMVGNNHHYFSRVKGGIFVRQFGVVWFGDDQSGWL